MASVKIKPSTLRGEIVIPSSKSHTIRALLFALMAKGKSHIRNPLPSPDTFAMLGAIRHLGAKVDMEQNILCVEGVSGKLSPAEDVIQCGNSGQVLRFIGALAALSPSYTILTGDLSIRHYRPVKPLLDALTQLGAFATSSRLDGYAPILIKGPLKGGKATLPGEDSQPISGLLILGAFFPLQLEVTNPGETPWIDLTLSWFDRLGIPYENRDYKQYTLQGGTHLKGFEYAVPGDFSSAAFPLAASLITQSEVTLHNLDLTDVQGDKEILSHLKAMGAKWETHGQQLTVRKAPSLQGLRIDVNRLIDALPILAVVGCFAQGETVLFNGTIARHKESDRIRCIATELRKMGAKIEEQADGLIIQPAPLRGSSELQAHRDHRIAMALSVAALAAEGESTIHGVECTTKSYPSFFTDFQHLGAQMELRE